MKTKNYSMKIENEYEKKAFTFCLQIYYSSTYTMECREICLGRVRSTPIFFAHLQYFQLQGGEGGVTSINKNDGEGGGGLDARFAYLWRGAKHQQRNPPPATTNSI